MATAGRATLFSGLTVAIGLALLLLMPLPFMRSMGAGAVLIPLVSIAASATLPARAAVGARHGRQPHPRGAQGAARTPRERGAGILVAPGAHDHAPPGVLPGGRRRPADRPGDARAAAARHERRQPRHAARHAGERRPLPARGRASDRARSRRSSSSCRPRAPAERARPPPSRPSCGSSRCCARTRASRPATIQAPALSSGAVDRQANLLDPDRADAADQGRRTHRRRHLRGERPRALDPQHLRPGRGLPACGPRAADGGARVRGRLRRQGLRRVPVARAGGARDHLLRAAARVPLGRAAGEGGAAQPALGQRRLRRARARVPARLGIGPRLPQLAPDRSLDPDLPVRDDLRDLDGLRGVPALAHARGVGSDARQRARGRLRARAHRAHHHGGRGDHDRRLLRAS